VPLQQEILSDNIRDTLYTICANLAPMAGFVHSKHGVYCKPTGLVPEYPTKCPADVGLLIRQTAPPHTMLIPVNTVAIDITVTSSPRHRKSSPAYFSNKLTYQGPSGLSALKLSHSTAVHDPTYFQTLITNQILLLPFTVDPFGGLGHHAHTTSSMVAPSPPKTQHHQNHHTTRPGIQLATTHPGYVQSAPTGSPNGMTTQGNQNIHATTHNI
jgi:hypothetical protein